MNTILTPRTLATLFTLLFICSHAAADPIHPQLPADVTMNKDAGRGNWLFVALRLESGEELPFFMDTGATFTGFDKFVEPKLGKSLGAAMIDHWGDKVETHVYTMPKLYSGTTPLMTGSNTVTSGFKMLSLVAGRRIKGILGMDCLRQYCIQLDFEAGKIRFLDPDQLNTAELGKAYPLTLEGNRVVIHHLSLTGGTNTDALIDTGLLYDGQVEKVVVQGHFWIRLRNFLVETVPFAEKLHRHLIAPQCDWDGETYTDLKVDVGGMANVIGLRFLARHLVTFDFPNGVMYLKKTSTGPLANQHTKGAAVGSKRAHG
ncbi:MAG: hypothetical protein JWR69_4333 [Pedosphaera sp.]|nr:hypothetical protein [Pedosphaera sp.]